MLNSICLGSWASFVALTIASAPASAQQQIEGQVLGAASPISNAIVTLFAASAGAPAQLSQAESSADGSFTLRFARAQSDDTSLYLVATGGVPAANKGSGNNSSIALLAVLGATPPAKVTINEMTTIASVWTHAQFLDNRSIKGHALGLRIAAATCLTSSILQPAGMAR